MFFKKRILRKYKDKLKNLHSKYNQKFQNEINKYTCILSHDIKTPLLAQNQMLSLIINNKVGEISHEQKKVLLEIFNSNQFLVDIVSNTIFLSKYELQKPQLKLENVDIVKQIEDCLSSIENFAKEKQQNIIIKTNKDKNIKLNADKKLIQKIISNLLASSITSGFENSNIEITINENKDLISFSAKNKSVYMTKEKISSLFEDKKNLCDFNQLGMSLNLNIAKKLIEAHSWDIIAESKKDNSSTFGFVVKKS